MGTEQTKQRIVVKVGTSTLTAGGRALNRQRILELVQQLAYLHQLGHEVVLVSSGAQLAGRERLSYPDFGRSVPVKQLLSAVGQSHLMRIYNDLFDIFGIVVAQVLLVAEDLRHRARYLNARDTLQTLLDRRIIPIVNENDTTATEEIRVGDNDNLSALVASALEADLLIILTDQPGLFTADPRYDTEARLIERVTKIDGRVMAIAGGIGTPMGTGGMMTKVEAAQLAQRSGVTAIIAAGHEPNVLGRIIEGEALGTRFEPAISHLESRKRWMLADKPQGVAHVDDGAVQVLLRGGASLLPVGVISVEGQFGRGALLEVAAPSGEVIARGLSNYDSEDASKLCGVKSQQILEVLGYSYGDSLIHRNNMVLLG